MVVVRAVVALLMVVAVGVGLAATAQAGGSPDPVAARGTVIEQSPIPAALRPAGAHVATRVEYRTVDRDGAPRTSTGAVYLPEGRPPAGGWPVVSYAHGTVGLADGCAPSTAGPLEGDGDQIEGWLAHGWAVVASDYAGLGTPGELAYLDGRGTARSVIDMVRAGRAVAPELGARWIVSGLSQGAHAAMSTARMAREEAPESDFRGAIAVGLPAGLELVFRAGVPGFPDPGLTGATKFSLFLFSGLDAARPGARPLDSLTEFGRRLVHRAREVCTVPFNDELRGVRIGDLIARPFAPLGPLLDDYVRVPTDGYPVPVLIGQGLADTVTPYPLGAGQAAAMRAAGQDVTFVELPGVGHVDSAAAVLPAAFVFADRVMAG